jgi:Na+-transporting methylmalonyl-CoA/oxaloacetate decarboxylase gamma subunit
MAEEKSSGGYGIVFLIVLVTVIILITAMVRDSNIRKIERQEKQAVTIKFIKMDSDMKVLSIKTEGAVSESKFAKDFALRALDKSEPNSERIDALAERIAVLEKRLEEQPTKRYIPTAYCTTEYDKFTKMIVMKCKEFPKK